MTVDVYGARVRQARVLRRMTSAAVLNAMDWKGARQTRLEHSDTTALSGPEFSQLVSFLRFPQEFFLTPPRSRVAVPELLFRAPRSTAMAEKEYLAQFSSAVGDFLEVLDARQRLPRVKLPGARPGMPVTVAAAVTRAALGLEADQPIGYLTHELERAGVAVVVRPDRLPRDGDGDGLERVEPVVEKHLGCSCWTGGFNERPLIVLRKVASWERTRWTLAHETGHLVMHTGDITEEMEDEAHRFAAELLAPRDVIAGALPAHITLHSLVELKSTWGISIGGLVRHLFDSGLITEQRKDMLQRQLYTRKNPDTNSTWGRTEPGWDDRKPEQPRLLSRWADRGFGTAHPGMLASMQQIWPRDVLEEMLLEQRQAPSRSDAAAAAVAAPASLGSSGSSVIDFSARRSLRQA